MALRRGAPSWTGEGPQTTKSPQPTPEPEATARDCQDRLEALVQGLPDVRPTSCPSPPSAPWPCRRQGQRAGWRPGSSFGSSSKPRETTKARPRPQRGRAWAPRHPRPGERGTRRRGSNEEELPVAHVSQEPLPQLRSGQILPRAPRNVVGLDVQSTPCRLTTKTILQVSLPSSSCEDVQDTQTSTLRPERRPTAQGVIQFRIHPPICRNLHPRRRCQRWEG